MKEKTRKLVTGLVCLLVFAGLLFLYFRPTTVSSSTTLNPSNFDDFAKCLTQNGAKMYGASWCPHCQKQKAMFGSSVQFINYIECAEGGNQAPVCTAAGIEGYPTWKFANGKQIAGEATFAELAQNTGCSLDLIK